MRSLLKQLWVIGILAGVPLAWGADADTREIPDAIVKKVDPSVVAIQHERGAGSGFVVSPDGYILTNGHVVQGNDAEDPTEPVKLLTVITHDEHKMPATVVGFCMDPDVALIKVETDAPLEPVEFTDSRAAQIGQRCFAVGTPTGLKRTFTKGILSNVDRADLNTFTTVLQTDAAINPGNSGGPLFDRQGRVLGINTYGSRGRNNLGFTIPIHVALELKAHFLKEGRFVRTDLPIFVTSEIYDELAATLGVSEGILIQYVMPGTPAEAAGLQAGDVITKIDGVSYSARTRAELLDFEWDWAIREPGKEVALTLSRGIAGAREQVVLKTTLEASEPMPRIGRLKGELIEHRYDPLGLGFKRLVRLHRLLYALTDTPGVLVTRVEPNSPAAKGGLVPQDTITHVAGEPVTDVASYQKALESHLRAREKAIELTIQRKKSTLLTAIAPYYDMKARKVALVVPSEDSEHLDLLVRELVAHGADVTLAAPPGVMEGDVDHLLGDIKGDDYDVLLFADGEGARALWSNEDALRLVKEAHAEEKILAALGTSALTLVIGEPELLETKITTTKRDSGEAMVRSANYTGEDVEKDGHVLTTTAFDRKTVREFLKELRFLTANAD